MDVIDRVPGLAERHAHLRQRMDDERLRHRAYTRAHGDDPPELRDWTWPGAARRGVGDAAAGAGADGQRRLEQPEAGAARRRGPRARRARSCPPGRRGRPRAAARGAARASSPGAEAASHRIVHGGERYREPVRARRARRAGAAPSWPSWRRCTRPRASPRWRRSARRCPACPHVACFDTAFHASIPPAAHTYALPAGWRERHPPAPLRLPRALARMGRHARAPSSLGGAPPSAEDRQLPPRRRGLGLRDRGGRSCDTTMGFTPLEGLVMATRSGSVDPGMLPWLMEHEGLSPARARRRARAPLGAARPGRQRAT